MKAHLHPADVRALSRLGIDAVTGVTDLVESMHLAIARFAPPLGRPPAGRTRGITGFVYRSVHGVTRAVGFGLDTALAALLPLLQRPADATKPSTPERAAVLAALNGVLGDYLEDTGNSLALPMQFSSLGCPLAPNRDDLSNVLTAPTGRVLVLIHGLCMNDAQWRRRSLTSAGKPDGSAEDDPWVTLARDLGFTPLHLNYNSGRHISSNGRDLGRLLDDLVAQWPQPVTDIAIVGHSMGGLVARSACQCAAVTAADNPTTPGWLPRLRAMIFLGTPHQGAPLERGGSWVDVLLRASPYSAPFARLGRIRSAGVTDLRHGNVVDADWQSRERFTLADHRVPVPLPAHVASYAIAASLGREAGDARDRLIGDGLVPVNSALGLHDDPSLRLEVPSAHCRTLYGRSHLDLLGDSEVLAQVRDWLMTAVSHRS